MRNWFTSLFWIPYDLWKDWAESSRLGMSEYDRESLRFWRRVGLAWEILKVLAFLALAALAWWFSSLSSGAPAKKDPAKRSALKVRSDTNWERMPEAQLREFTSYFSEPANPKKAERVITDIETLVADGETVVTQAYEPEPGFFVFSVLTPTIEKSDGEATRVHVDARSFRVGVSGSYQEFGRQQMDLGTGDWFTVGTLSPGRMYILGVSADADPQSSMIKLTAKGSSDPISEEASRLIAPLPLR